MADTDTDEDAALEARLAALEQEVDAEHAAAEAERAAIEEELGMGPEARARRKAEEAAAAAAEDERDPDEPPCIAEDPAEDGSRRVHVPCVHCRDLNRFRLREPKGVYGVRCRECRTRYQLELATVQRVRVKRSRTAVIGLGLVGMVGSALGGASRFLLRVAIQDAARDRDLDFLALNPLQRGDFFSEGDLVGLVHRDETLVAVANYRRRSWITTRDGGVEGLFGSEGRDAEEDEDDGWI